MVKIRLSRGGRKNSPIFTIVATSSRNSATGKFIERLGKYDPRSENILANIKTDRIAYWLGTGAELSDSVSSLFKKHKIDIK
ncbi:MAG: 30S ribosomal protein S16 [Bdellovibrionales bacterium RIFOXYD12_FULL_39_22]|nr:MAG: 30S ribosomal protein S16 [Bdellovibrionales bacterium RIFOXYB1_FULL_39_21]OFZ41688.1 MAG: 30S ribosomal protein S16 [Bdellovibrionales bacterium RIFOXYC12_FULL_39_17]OFZ46088.1 MAG: 30S ribosomal protein S16 [Bdellovibrionales bacterium RIFOXYC1_FULL_39_130]OFZ74915.1 MAG: 30S ribosomal protein S16 [Bdellovibrionales bacterium RIFOXYD1_FULL_39_84]OFZ75148.1 MAG: 30S ribosomal protein S16 [Bdellovibrionales bacterium RIFOXYC2_FULL_39_8]OFZ92768.1 MAG: 30S ribosomal protein S16 [Bdellov